MQGGQRFLPPRLDVHSPDLYLPVMGLWTYVIGVLMLQLVQHKYKPDSMYALVGQAGWVGLRVGGCESGLYVSVSALGTYAIRFWMLLLVQHKSEPDSMYALVGQAGWVGLISSKLETCREL